MRTTNSSKAATRAGSKPIRQQASIARNAHYLTDYPVSSPVSSALDRDSIPGPEPLATGLQALDASDAAVRDHSAEHQLAIAILEMSLREYEHEPESRKVVREWIDDRNGPPPFGFDAVCEYLAVNSDYLRRGLTRWMDALDSGIGAVSPLGSGMRVRNRSKSICLDRKRNRGS